MLITLDKRKVIYQQIYDQLRQLILSGKLYAGDPLPASRELAQSLAVSRTSVLSAYEQLAAEGYINTQVGAGTFVADVPYIDAAPRPKRKIPTAMPALSHKGLYVQGLFSDKWSPWDKSSPASFDFRISSVHFPRRSAADWRKLTHECAQTFTTSLGEPQGDRSLREAIAAHLVINRRCRCNADNIVIVNGSQQAFTLLAGLFLDAGDTVALEKPGYPGARSIFESHQATIHSLPVDTHGVQVEALDGSKSAPKLIYSTPSHQFPTGVTMTLSRRMELIEWAEKHGGYIIEDDYDSEFRYDGRPVESIQGLDTHNRTLYVGTFSKIVFPSLRLGYVLLPESLVEPFVALRWLTDFQSASFEQHVMAKWMATGAHLRHLRRMRKIYGRRRSALIASIHRHFNEHQIKLSGDAAGLHVLLWLKEVDVAMQNQLLAQCAEQSVAVYPVDREDAYEGPCGLILGFAAIDQEDIDLGIRNLAKAIQRVSGSVAYLADSDRQTTLVCPESQFSDRV